MPRASELWPEGVGRWMAAAIRQNRTTPARAWASTPSTRPASAGDGSRRNAAMSRRGRLVATRVCGRDRTASCTPRTQRDVYILCENARAVQPNGADFDVKFVLLGIVQFVYVLLDLLDEDGWNAVTDNGTTEQNATGENRH